MRRLLILLAILLVSEPAAHAETRELIYDMVLDGASVGRRRVTLRYLPAEHGEIRMLESYTEFSVLLGRKPFTFVQRLSGMGAVGPSGFVSSMREGGRPEEVQLTERLDGWRITLASNGRLKSWDLPTGAFDATSLTLVDPDAAVELVSSASILRVLSAETGNVIEGPIESIGASTLKIAGQQMNVTRWRWTLPVGPVELSYGPAGHLVAYTVLVAGKTVEVQLQAVPEPRTYGDTLEVPLIGPGVDITEL
ncbi:MAG: hypothetical protein VX519_05670 [Myxococcota bacterium]|nr:hypothetical protein [Myxococcota bacterium]